MKKSGLNKIMCIACAGLLLSVPVITGDYTSYNGASAYSIVDGEKRYSIAADKIIYRTDAPFDETINTFEAWIKLPENLADAVECGVIMGNYFNLPTGYPGGVNFGVGKGGKFELYWNFGTGATNKGDKFNVEYHKRFENTDLRTGEWTHVALVRDKANDGLDYYVNGALDEHVDISLSESVCDMIFGIGSDWNNWFNDKTPFMGAIRQITLYSEAVGAETVATDMEQTAVTQADREGLGLMANWYFTEKWGEQRNVADSSGANAHCSRATIDCYVDAQFENDFDYSFVVVPDMQAMTYHKPQNFSAQSDWILGNADRLNIKFAMYLGDMTESRYSTAPENSENEWRIASAAIQKLDGKIPYSVVLGNHDYDNWATQSRTATMFGKYFPYAKYSAAPTFGGAFEKGDMANVYHIFRVGGIKYLVFALEYGPRTTVLNWVDRITEEHPDCRVIVTSHSIVSQNGNFVVKGEPHDPSTTISYDSANNGSAMWEKAIKKRNNMFMTFSGHLCVDDVVMRTDNGDCGNTVRSTLINAQGAMMTSAMNTLLLVQVNERTKTMRYCYYSPEFDACYNEQNQFSFSFADAHNPAVGIPGGNGGKA